MILGLRSWDDRSLCLPALTRCPLAKPRCFGAPSVASLRISPVER